MVKSYHADEALVAVVSGGEDPVHVVCSGLGAERVHEVNRICRLLRVRACVCCVCMCVL